MKILKLLIPSGSTKNIDEIESYTVEWSVLTGWSNEREKYHKVFTNETDADDFESQLKQAAKFTKAAVWTKKYKN